MKKILTIAAISAVLISGCGYTTRSLLPANYKSIYVENVKNLIKITAEQSDQRMYRGYTPGMEIEMTKAFINKFIADGNIRINSAENADLILKSELIDYNRGAIIYNDNYSIEEYRIKMIVNLELFDVKANKQVWQEKGFAGETTYRTGGSLAKTEAAAVRDAIDDLARRVVERTVEAW